MIIIGTRPGWRTMKSLMLNYIYICSENRGCIVEIFMTINVWERFLNAKKLLSQTLPFFN